jgi:hypothetical protein
VTKPLRTANTSTHNPRWEVVHAGWEWVHPVFGTVRKTRAKHKFEFDYWLFPSEVTPNKKLGPYLKLSEAKEEASNRSTT